jgi:hypothetical protein
MQGIESAYSIRAQEEKIPQKKAGYMTQVPYLPKSDAFFLDQPAGPYMTRLLRRIFGLVMEHPRLGHGKTQQSIVKILDSHSKSRHRRGESKFYSVVEDRT